MINTSLKYFLFALVFSLTIISKAQLQANFNADTTKGCEAISAVQFNDLSTGSPTSWLWDFGNGNTSPLQNPIASYASPGVYTVSLTISKGGNQDTETKTNYIEVYNKPNASFTVANNVGCPPLPVQFNSTSTIGNAPISKYTWDFGDGSQPGIVSNPTHTYQTSGSYPVSLQIEDQNGCRDNEIFNSVTVTVAPTAAFSSSKPTSCIAPHTVNFINNSQGTGLSYQWSFGDGNTSTQANPSHTYTSIGSYTVSLVVSDANCSSTSTRSNYVRLENISTQFSPPSDSICFGEAFTPINNTVGANLFRWEWGDGSISSDKNPSHIYQDSGWFYIRLIASNGPICIQSFTDSIYVQRLSADFTTSKQYFCDRGDTVIFTATGTNVDTYNWNNNDARIFGISENPYIHIQNNIGIFNDTLVASSKLGCQIKVVKDSNRVAEEIRANIITGISNGCEPFKTKFRSEVIGPGPITNYQWDFKNGDSAFTSFTDSITFDTAGIYWVELIVTNSLGCIDRDVEIVSVGTKQTPNFTIPYDSICPYDSIWIENLSTDTSLIDFYNFQISNPQGDLQTASADSFQNYVHFTDFTSVGYYEVRLAVTDRGCVENLTIDSMFYIEGPIVDITFTPNCTNRLVVPFDGGIQGTTRFYWNFGDGSPIDSVNMNPTHIFPKDTLYKIILIAYNDTNTCNVMVDSITLDLRTPPPLEVIPEFDNYCLGDKALAGYQYYTQYPSPYWLLGNDTISDSIAVFINLDTIGPLEIELRSIDYLGCPHVDTDTIYTYQPRADFTSNATTGCVPHQINFFDSSYHDTTIAIYRWNFGQNSASSLKNPTATYTQNQNYTVSLYVENIFGCKDSISKPAYITHDPLTANFIEDKLNICQGESVFFRNISVGNLQSYEWNFGDGTTEDTSFSPTHQFTTAGRFNIQLIVIDVNGCSDTLRKNQRIFVQPKPTALFSSDTSIANCYPLAVNFTDESIGNIVSWNWTFGDLSNSVFENPFHNYTLPGKYDVSLIVATANGCKDTIVVPEYIKTVGPIATFIKDKDTICINEMVRYEIQTSDNVYSYTWDFGDGNSGSGSPISHTYISKTGKLFPTLILSDSAGFCVVPIMDSLFVQNVKADFNISDTLACNIPYKIDFSNTSVGANSFTWNINNSIFSTPNPSYTFNQYGIYIASLSISSALGCLDTITQKITIASKPAPAFSNDAGICLGDSILLTASGGSRYEWSPTKSLRFIDEANAWAKPDSTTTYKVVVYNEAGCSDSLSAKITVPLVTGMSNLRDTTVFLGASFIADAFIGQAFNYVWTPSTGLSCDDCPRPTVKPNESIQYIVQIFDDYNCFSITDTLNVEVDDLVALEVPNAFSPNGDQINDIIYAKGIGIKELVAFKIYNRLGELIFESNRFDKGWDGTYKSVPQPIETYVFTAEGISFSDETVIRKGNISLIR